MTLDDDKARGIFQVLTSPGPAAIAVLRLEGERTDEFFRRHLRTPRNEDPGARQAGAVFRAELLDEDGAAIDDILVSIHATDPASDVRLHLHGSPWIVRKCAELLRSAGFCEQRSPAPPLWPADNLIQAEAQALLPEMLTLRGVEWLSRQSELLPNALRKLAISADVDAAKAACRQIADRRHIVDRFRRAARIALVGPPNAGKSTLANALADRQVSLVSPRPGTTRDWIESLGDVAGFPVVLLDTAGLRDSDCELEAEGVRRSLTQIESANAILLVLDAAAPETWAAALEHLNRTPACVAINKTDLTGCSENLLMSLPERFRDSAVPIAAAARAGLDALSAKLAASVGEPENALAEPAAFTDRQVDRLTAALALDRERFLEPLAAILSGRDAR